jgi:hypothetical protein
MADIGGRSWHKFQIRPPKLCGINDELLWLERRVREGLRRGAYGQRAVSLGQISLQMAQLRREHFDACDTCGRQPWMG